MAQPSNRLAPGHDLPTRLAVFAFDDLLEAKQWALDTQKGRRNLDKWELGKIALKLRPEIEARAKANQGARTDLSATLPEVPHLWTPAKNWLHPLASGSARWAR